MFLLLLSLSPPFPSFAFPSLLHLISTPVSPFLLVFVFSLSSLLYPLSLFLPTCRPRPPPFTLPTYFLLSLFPLPLLLLPFLPPFFSLHVVFVLLLFPLTLFHLTSSSPYPPSPSSCTPKPLVSPPIPHQHLTDATPSLNAST